jgi:hypothetical protein
MKKSVGKIFKSFCNKILPEIADYIENGIPNWFIRLSSGLI